VTVLDLAVEPLDVDAAALGLLLDAEPPPALAELRIASHAGELVLAVLSASHVVTATHGSARLTEQVSCAAGGGPLPEQCTRPAYDFRSRTTTLPDLAPLAERLRAERGDWVVGAFPGGRSALTALTGAAVPGGWSWQTWHLYPGRTGGTVVETWSTWRP
jgi:hypothetical protein